MEIVKDPVCGEMLEWRMAGGVVTYRGRLYYFCGSRCRERFHRSPKHFADRG